MSTKEQNKKGQEQDQNLAEKEADQRLEQEEAAAGEVSSEKEEIDELESLTNEIQKEKDNFLRLFAEFENYKKRTSRERIELFSTANKELMLALLPVLDDFERGLNEIEKSSEGALLEGMKIIYKKFKNTLIRINKEKKKIPDN